MPENKMGRFNQRARRVLSLAQEEAERLQHSYIGTEHMLLGLMREEGGIAGCVLRALGLEQARMEALVEELTHPSPRTNANALDLFPGTKQVLELAVDEARRMGHHYIGTEHLLLGLVRQTDGVAIEVLKRLGVRPEDVRRQTRKALQEMPVKAAAPSPSEAIRKAFTSQTMSFEILTAAITKIIDMVAKDQLRAAQAAELLTALQPWLSPDSVEKVRLAAIPDNLNTFARRQVTLTITRIDDDSVIYWSEIPMKYVLTRFTGMLEALTKSPDAGIEFSDEFKAEYRMTLLIQ